MPTALIIGASRGLGFEFARQYLSQGWTVHATHRSEDDRIRLRDLGAVAPTVVAAPEPLEIKPETGEPESTPSTLEGAAPSGEASDKSTEPKDVSEDKAPQEPEKDAKSE